MLINNLKEVKNKNKGITLVALIITIIILLILAGVTIASLQNSGLFGKTQEATEQSKQAEFAERLKLAIMESVTADKGELKAVTLRTVLAENFKSENGETIEGEDFPFTVKSNNRTAIIAENGGITIDGVEISAGGNTGGSGGQTGGNNLTPGGTATGGNKEYTDNSYSGEDKTVTIPEGFTVSGVTGNVSGTTDETKIESGLVIYNIPAADLADSSKVNWETAEGIETIQENYDQFVWVPVPDSSKFTRNDWKNWDGDVTHEPTAYTTTTLTSGVYSEGQATDPTGKYTEMYNSVTSNHGFYIGRYEAGVNSTTKRTAATAGGETVVSRKGKAVYNYVPWGKSMSDYTSQVSDKNNSYGAAYLSKNNIVHPSGTTTLIYGVQWDAVMRWLSKDSTLRNKARASGSGGNAAGSKHVIQDSTGYGNYTDTNATLGTPGNTGLFAMKNIYDMAGNVWELTMETHGNDSRAFRGGYYGNDGSERPVSYRSNDDPSRATDSVGFRVALYL